MNATPLMVTIRMMCIPKTQILVFKEKIQNLVVKIFLFIGKKINFNFLLQTGPAISTSHRNDNKSHLKLRQHRGHQELHAAIKRNPKLNLQNPKNHEEHQIPIKVLF